MNSGTYDPQRYGLRVDAGEPGQATHLRETQKIGNHGLATPVLVGAAWMQAIATAPGFRVDQGGSEIVAAEKPLESPHSVTFPTRVAVYTPRGETRGYGRGRLEWLLI